MWRRWRIFLRLVVLIFVLSFCKEPETWFYQDSYGFSPNGDGINDVFIIPFDTTKTSQMTIIDSKNNKEVLNVFQYQRNWWNGRQNNTGRLVTEGLYKFYLEIDRSYTFYGYVYVKY